jgi:hypothetical protein
MGNLECGMRKKREWGIEQRAWRIAQRVRNLLNSESGRRKGSYGAGHKVQSVRD